MTQTVIAGMIVVGFTTLIGLAAWILKEIYALRIEVTGAHAAYDQLHTEHESNHDDHEARIRALEKRLAA